MLMILTMSQMTWTGNLGFMEQEEVILKNKEEREHYQSGLQLLQQRQLKQAYDQFRLFRNQYPKSERYDDALFYIAYIQVTHESDRYR